MKNQGNDVIELMLAKKILPTILQWMLSECDLNVQTLPA